MSKEHDTLYLIVGLALQHLPKDEIEKLVAERLARPEERFIVPVEDVRNKHPLNRLGTCWSNTKKGRKCELFTIDGICVKHGVNPHV